MRRLLALALICLVGCQTKPTVVREGPERKMENADRLLEPVRITKETIVVDARPSFEYSLAHIPRSIPMNWSDYTEAEPSQRGILQADLFAASRRLARYGITPDSSVVVVGRGRSGEGEEGRIAWMLAYLGVSKVQFADLTQFKVNFSNVIDDFALKSAPMWKPEPIESLNVTRGEVLFAINKRGVDNALSFRPGSEPAVYRIIDVRAAKNYLGREGLGARRNVPNIDAINIPWVEFFTPDFRPSMEIAAKLQSVGVLPSHRVIVMDETGVSSAAVTMALRAIGFSKAGNYSGGLNDLMSSGLQ